MSTYLANEERGGNYNEEIGLDIDGEVVQSEYRDGKDLYDYDLISKPNVGVSGSGIIIPSEIDAGFPSVDDYIRNVNPDGSISLQLKKFINDDQSGSLNTMLGDVNNGRLSNIKVVADISVPENTDIIIKKDNNQSSIKGILEENSLNDLFFSETNINVLQDTLRYKVFQKTDKVISKQSDNELYIIMRSIMLQFANFRTGIDNIVDEIRRLNKKVIEYSVDNVSSNVMQHEGYIEDLSKLPTPMDHPVSHNKGNFTYDISNLL